MKNECREFLQDYISQCCQNAGLYDFCTLFKHFSAFEIRCKEDIKPAIDDFFAFLVDCNASLFKSGLSNPPKLIKYSVNAMQFLFLRPISAEQQIFADIVKEIAPKKENTHILEVGAGMYPKAAIYMAETYDHIYAMDKDFMLSKESLKGMNVTSYHQFFDVNTQIEQYDLVVGRCPCKAISSIVENCVQHNKPYFIELCDCVLPRDAEGRKSVRDWQNILLPIDPSLVFTSSGMVYHLDATSDQVERMFTSKPSLKSQMMRQNKKASSGASVLQVTDFQML